MHGALAPGGLALTLEFVPNDDRVSPPIPAAFSLTMLAVTEAGDAYTFGELQHMYQAAGFHNIASRPVPSSPQTVLLAYK